MSSTAKALSLLFFFSEERAELGLSQMCRLSGHDKATTYRYLQTLEAAGLIEQNPTTRHYRMGPAVLHLAQVREETVPRKEGARAALAALADATGETSHATVLSGSTLYALDSCASPHHSTRTVIDINVFPLHATASGICTLAFGPQDLLNAAAGNLKEYTAQTPTNQATLERLIHEARTTGFSHADRIFETDVSSIAAPVFDHTGQVAGAVAVASVAARVTPDQTHLVKMQLTHASRQITRNWGGKLPQELEAAWAHSLSQPPALEPAS